MIWQDAVMTVANSIFALSLIPQVYHGFKEKKGFIKPATSVPTFISIYAVAFSFYTLSLFFSSITAAITGTLWLILFIQRQIYPPA
ncbi:MAG TPA: hypothetical protein VJC16_05190 [Candidatus Nanoarchaeia archaeon]|nr:hypothetical protein [Candidatus Nanoarchaeia archaeon]